MDVRQWPDDILRAIPRQDVISFYLDASVFPYSGILWLADVLVCQRRCWSTGRYTNH
jgi:hypothetical protein